MRAVRASTILKSLFKRHARVVKYTTAAGPEFGEPPPFQICSKEVRLQSHCSF
jgi:hypothetical protein